MIDIAYAAEQAVELAAATHEGADVGVLGSLGINGKLFIAQLINFAVVLLVLWRFAWKPLVRMLHDRQAHIDEGIQNASKAASELQMAELHYQKKIQEAGKQATQLLVEAEVKAEKFMVNAKERARVEINAMMESAKAAVHAEQKKMEQELKNKTVELICDIAEKYIDTKLDAKKDQVLVASLLEKK